MPTATFVLSTGRCGTQWLTEALANAMGERARVEHEPLHNRYHPRRMLGAREPEALGEAAARPILTHVADIERELETRDYIETGHPCWSSLPWLARRLAGRIRIVHLVRHPVTTACSWVSHGAFVPPLLPHLPVKELISPEDAGAGFGEYREAWPTLGAFEKCLVYWAEVNAFGLRLERAAATPWLRVRYEDVFSGSGDGLTRLLDFVGAPEGALARIDRGEQVDQHRFALERWPEVERIARHPRIVELAEELGYEATDFSRAGLAARFRLGESAAGAENFPTG